MVTDALLNVDDYPVDNKLNLFRNLPDRCGGLCSILLTASPGEGPDRSGFERNTHLVRAQKKIEKTVTHAELSAADNVAISGENLRRFFITRLPGFCLGYAS